MLKYFKKQKCRLNSTNENSHHYKNNNTAGATTRAVTDEVDGSEKSFNAHENVGEDNGLLCKRHSLRSTSSFCDEIFLEELANAGLLINSVSVGGGGGAGSDDDAYSNSAISLGAVSSGTEAAVAVNSIVGFDEGLFKYHSRLSMTVTSIVSEPNCLSYFIQFLDSKNALPLIKFYLDTENFKNSALAQLRKEQMKKITNRQMAEESDYESTINATNTFNNTDDQIQNKQQQQQQQQQLETQISLSNVSCSNAVNAVPAVPASNNEVKEDVDNSNVPELKTLCDLTMRKPLTDDEKSQIYAETNMHIINSRTSEQQRYKLKASSEQSLSLSSLASYFSEINENSVVSKTSVRDALAIYKKYLIQDAKQLINLPIDILSKISLIICKKGGGEEEQHQHNAEDTISITADCFLDAQQYVLTMLDKDFLNDFLQSAYYAKYCVELIDGHQLNINDILHSEVTLFYFMEYLEQHQDRDCLDFWSTAINYRKSYVTSLVGCDEKQNEKEAQADAMIIYEKFFSLQSDMKLWSSSKLRAHVEACICTEGMVYYCFDLPLKVAGKYLECKYLKTFLKSSLFSNYINELKSKIQEESEASIGLLSKYPSKLTLRRCTTDKKSSNRHRKTLSDCTFDKKVTISQHNTLLASMDSSHSHQQYDHSTSTAHLKQFQLNIDSSQLTNPNLLWQRSNSNNLKFGRVNSLGRYERDFCSPADALHKGASGGNWSLSLNGTKLKNAMRKLVHLPEDNVQEEIAWQVAEMIVKDVTSVTMGSRSSVGKDIVDPNYKD